MPRSLLFVPTVFALSLTALFLPFGPLSASGLKTQPELNEQSCEVGETPLASQVDVPLPTQDYEPSPAMWKIADEDTTIYLFGTYHVLPEGFRWRTEMFDELVANVDEVVFETRTADEQPAASANLDRERFMQLMRDYRAETPLSQRLSKHNRRKFLNLLAEFELPAEGVEFAPPMMAMLIVSMASSMAEGSQREFGVETVIAAEFTDRPISAIEDPIAVMESLFRIDEARLVSEIDKSFDEWHGCAALDLQEVDWSSEHAWAQGELDDNVFGDWFDDPFTRLIYDALLTDRNYAWGQWIEDRLEQPGNLLIAVGAGHMEGPESLLVKLEDRDIEFERIQ